MWMLINYTFDGDEKLSKLLGYVDRLLQRNHSQFEADKTDTVDNVDYRKMKFLVTFPKI